MNRLRCLALSLLAATSVVSAFHGVDHYEHELNRREPYSNIDRVQQGLQYRDTYPDVYHAKRNVYPRDAYPQPYYESQDLYQRDAYPEAYYQERDIYERDVYERDAYSDYGAAPMADLMERGFYSEDFTSFSPHMKRATNVDIYIGVGNRRSPNEALHWMLLVAPVGSDKCTYYHVTGGPTQGTPFKLEIQANKRLDSNGIDQKHKLSTVPDKELNKIKAAAQGAAIPASPKNCQNWVVDVLGKLEKKGLVPAGTEAQWSARVEAVKAKTPSPEPEGRARSKSPTGSTKSGKSGKSGRG